MAGASTKSGLAYTRLADIYKATGKRDQAESVLRKAIEVEPGLAAAQVALIDLLVTAKRQSDASELIKRMQRDAPTSPDGYNLEAVFHLRNKAPDEALAVLRKGVANTGSPMLAVTLHRLLMRMKKTADADRLAASWMKDHPKDFGFAYQVAEAAMGRKQFDEAESRFKKLLLANPDDVLVLNNLAYVLMQRNRSEAVTYAQKATELAPGNAMVLDTLAAALAADKQLDKALTTQKRAVELSPGADDLRLNLAALALKSGDTALARKELARLQELGAKFNRQDEVARLMKTL
jgi:Flp pilus assembly protein TadD